MKRIWTSGCTWPQSTLWRCCCTHARSGGQPRGARWRSDRRPQGRLGSRRWWWRWERPWRLSSGWVRWWIWVWVGRHWRRCWCRCTTCWWAVVDSWRGHFRWWWGWHWDWSNHWLRWWSLVPVKKWYLHYFLVWSQHYFHLHHSFLIIYYTIHQMVITPSFWLSFDFYLNLIFCCLFVAFCCLWSI